LWDKILIHPGCLFQRTRWWPRRWAIEQWYQACSICWKRKL